MAYNVNQTPSVPHLCAILLMQSQQRPKEESAKDKSSIWDWTPPGDLTETGAWKVLRELAMTLSKSVPCTLKLLFRQTLLCCFGVLHTQQALLHRLQNCRLYRQDELINCACSTLQTSDLVYTLPYTGASYMSTVQLTLWQPWTNLSGSDDAAQICSRFCFAVSVYQLASRCSATILRGRHIVMT